MRIPWLAQNVIENCSISTDDIKLVQRYGMQRDEEAFRALLIRHGPMVLGVCRRILRHESDAEDAFQAAFLVLSQRARTLQFRRGVGPWLYGVAYRTSMKVRTQRRHQHSDVLLEAIAGDSSTERDEALAELDEEIGRLPASLKEVIVLCELQGHTQRTVAAMLRVPHGTVSGRIMRARKLLAERMIRRSHGEVAATAAMLNGASLVAATVLPQPLLDKSLAAIMSGTKGSAGKIWAIAAAVMQGLWWREAASLLIGLVLLISIGTGVILAYQGWNASVASVTTSLEPPLIKVEKDLMEWDIDRHRPAGVVELIQDPQTKEYRPAPLKTQMNIVRIIPGVELRSGDQRASLGMVYSTANHATFLPESVVRRLKTKVIRQVDLSKDDPQALALFSLSNIPFGKQTVFEVVQIDEFDLGLGPTGQGPLEAYVIKDAVSGIGYFGTTWARSLSRKGYSLVSYAAGAKIYYGRLTKEGKFEPAPATLLRQSSP